MLIITGNLIAVFVSAFILFDLRQKKISISFLSLLVFDAAYVFPLLVESFFGDANLPYYGFKLAQSDVTTNMLYIVFVTIVQFIFYLKIKKNKKGLDGIYIYKKINDSRNKISKNGYIGIFLLLFSIIPLLVWLLSPNPAIYFSDLGAFEFGNTYINAYERAYDDSIINLGKYIGFIGIVGLKFYDKKSSLVLKLLRFTSIIFIAVLDGKRTFFAFLMIILLTIDLITLSPKSSRVKVFKTLYTGVIIIGYFILYAYITGKYELNTDWYSVFSEYFFRSNSVKVSIYSSLNPEQLNILDYSFQTLIYDLFYFIPRNIWLTKPFPFPQYFSSAVRGFTTFTTLDWYFQTGIYSEIISNVGLIGIFLSPIVVIFLCNLVDNSKKSLTTLLGMSFVILIQVFEYSDFFKIVFALWIFFLLWEKIITNNLRLVKI